MSSFLEIVFNKGFYILEQYLVSFLWSQSGVNKNPQVQLFRAVVFNEMKNENINYSANILSFPLFHFSNNFLQWPKPTQFPSTGLGVLSSSPAGLVWKNFTNSNVASDQCPDSALHWFLQRSGTRCENHMRSKQAQKPPVYHNQRIKSPFEGHICSKAVFRGQQHWC